MDSSFVAYGRNSAMGRRRSQTIGNVNSDSHSARKGQDVIRSTLNRSRSEASISLIKPTGEDDYGLLISRTTLPNTKRTTNRGDESSFVPLKTIKQRRDIGLQGLFSKATNWLTDVTAKRRRKSEELAPRKDSLERTDMTISAPAEITTMTALTENLTSAVDDCQTNTKTNFEHLDNFAAKEIKCIEDFTKGNGNRVHKRVDFLDDIVLHDTITRDELDSVCELLQKKPDIDLEKPAHSAGITPLHRAAIEGAYRCLNLLLSHNVSVNVRDVFGWSPLHDAVYHGHVRCAAALITAGADIEAETNEFSKPIEMAEDDDMLLLIGRAMTVPGFYFDPDRETLV